MRKTILETSALLRKRELSPVELTRECLAKIEKLNPSLNAFISVTTDAALAQARQAEKEIADGKWRGPLHGIPVGLKDLIDTAGIRTTAASALFQDRIATEDAEVVRRLRNAGAVLLGKQNLHECAYGGSSIISHFGEVHNPWRLAHIAGGSSGGSAAAVAADLCFGAIGTDTGGSIREPASLCGIVGLKPTYGRVSVRGIIPHSLSLDHIGPITRNVSDAAVMLQVIAGHDPKDSTSAKRSEEDYVGAMASGSPSFRIGVVRGFFTEELNAEVGLAMDEAIKVLRTLAAETRDITLDVATDRTLQAAEVYAYHAEFVARCAERYHPETLRRLRSGENVTKEAVEQRRRELKKSRRAIMATFRDVDLLVTPTTPIPAPEIAELRQSPELLRPRELVLLRNTRPFNTWGLPAISVPCGFTKTGLPIGLQIAGPHWGETAVLQFARAYEHATKWHEREPLLQQ